MLSTVELLGIIVFSVWGKGLSGLLVVDSSSSFDDCFCVIHSFPTVAVTIISIGDFASVVETAFVVGFIVGNTISSSLS